MRFICFLAALVAVAIASPVSENKEMEKRLIPGLLGGGKHSRGGLLDSVLGGGDGGGLLDSVLGGGDGGGLLDSVLGGGEGGGLLDSILGGGEGGGLLDSVLGGGESSGLVGGLVGTVTNLVGTLLKTVLGILGGLTGGSSGEPAEADLTAEFDKVPLANLCPACGKLQAPGYIEQCNRYCASKNYKG